MSDEFASLEALAAALGILSPVWWPLVRRLLVVAPMRQGKPTAGAGCIVLYLVAFTIPSSSIAWVILYKIPSGFIILPFIVAGWLPLVIAFVNDPLLKRQTAA